MGQRSRVSALREFTLVGLLVAVTSCGRGCSCEPEPTGPQLEELPPEQGLLTLRFPNRPMDWDATVIVSDQRSYRTRPTGFPVRVAVPLDQDGVVEASAEGYGFRRGFRLSTQRRELEIVIRLEELRSYHTYGFTLSELPRETGFQPARTREAGEPAARLLEYRSSVKGDLEPSWWGLTVVLVDEGGVVWRQERASDKPPSPWTKLGEVQNDVVEHLRELLRQRLDGTLVKVPGCGAGRPDRSLVWAYRTPGLETSRVTLADDCKRLETPAATELAAWWVAVWRQILAASR